MKTITFVLQKISKRTPQIDFAIKEFIQPYVHQVLLIYLLPEQIYTINDPWAMLMCTKVCEELQLVRKNNVKKFLGDIDKKFKCEFGDDIEVTKVVLCGNERYKLNACLTSLHTELVVLGPDTKDKGYKNMFFKSLDSFLEDDVGVAIMRVPGYYNVYNFNDGDALKTLIYCSKCFKNIEDTHPNKPLSFYIGECMHVLCKNCFNQVDICTTCHASSSFIILEPEFIGKLLKNPNEAFMEPIESNMFQLSSALNLIIHQKSEIVKLKHLLRRAKDEIEKIKTIKKTDQVTTKQSCLFNFNKNEVKTDNKVKDTINRIYHKDKAKTNEENQDIRIVERAPKNESTKKKNNYLMELTNRGRTKKYFTDYNPSEHSVSSLKSTRLTIPNKESEFKYVYRKQNGFK